MAKYSKSWHNQLRYDADSLESLILNMADRFDIRVVMCQDADSQARTLLLTSGLALLGGVVGRKLQGGTAGAVAGGAVGVACGLAVAAASMRTAWPDLKSDSTELLKLVYKHLLKLNVSDYYAMGVFLRNNVSAEKALAKLIVKYLSKKLHKQVVSSLL